MDLVITNPRRKKRIFSKKKKKQKKSKFLSFDAREAYIPSVARHDGKQASSQFIQFFGYFGI